MSSPIVIHVLRPYASEDEYLAHERFSIEAKTMLLIDQPALPANTVVVFDVALTNGQKPIRAEGKVLGHVQAEGSNPGGLRVRFKRFGAATKAFIDRAVGARVTGNSVNGASLAPEAETNFSLVPEAAASASLLPEAETYVSAVPAAESSGVHRKAVLPVAAPLNREALLARLRDRRAG